jgi:hypothetical protein
VVNELFDDIHSSSADGLPAELVGDETDDPLGKPKAVAPAAGQVEPRSERTREAKPISDASYDPATERLRVTFRDGTTRK